MLSILLNREHTSDITILWIVTYLAQETLTTLHQSSQDHSLATEVQRLTNHPSPIAHLSDMTYEADEGTNILHEYD